LSPPTRSGVKQAAAAS